MQSTSLLPSLPGFLWLGAVALDKGPIHGSNRTKLRTYAKLNCLKENCFDILASYLCLAELLEIELFLTLKLYLQLIELFGIELFRHVTVETKTILILN